MQTPFPTVKHELFLCGNIVVFNKCVLNQRITSIRHFGSVQSTGGKGAFKPENCFQMLLRGTCENPGWNLTHMYRRLAPLKPESAHGRSR